MTIAEKDGRVTVTVREALPPELVVAARDGDRRARDEFVRGCLPLVYNIVGRAAERDLDVARSGRPAPRPPPGRR